mmetsp:Transcript_2292/g.3614  ORF Transcript_2292/g.3614 Transcript_2292/m.3614 type:complete len:296 (-) Transcript_2292:346-1233(-)
MQTYFVITTLYLICLTCTTCTVAALMPTPPKAVSSLTHKSNKRSKYGNPTTSGTRREHELLFTSRSTYKLQASSGSSIISTTDTITKSSSSIKDKIANFLGYIMGIGAMSLYAPIALKLLTSRNSDGLSITTWIFNVLGTMLAICYPAKKGFAFSTYVELTAVLTQGVMILGLVCLFQGKGVQYLGGMIPVLLSFAAFLKAKDIPPSVLSTIQIISIALCVSANLPQILLTYQLKHASWSWITAMLSSAGCGVRIFTTLQLTKDKLALLGYVLGFLTNGVLFSQVIIYNYLGLKW